MKGGGKLPKKIYNARKEAAINAGRAVESDFERMYGGHMAKLRKVIDKEMTAMYGGMLKQYKKKYGGKK